MEEKLRQLKTLLNEASDLEHVVELLEWDAETYMPPAGAQDRAYHRATVESLMHRKFVSEEVGRLLEELKPWAEQLDPDFGRCSPGQDHRAGISAQGESAAGDGGGAGAAPYDCHSGVAGSAR